MQPQHVNNARELLTSLLSHCSSAKHLSQIHGFMLPRGLHHDTLLLTKLIHASSAMGLFHLGFLAFAHNTHQPNIHLYNTIINALSRQPHYAKEAIFLYNQLQPLGFRPDTYSFPFVLKAVGSLPASLHVGRQIHCQAIVTGLDSDVHVGTALVKLYSNCGCCPDAHKVFDEMHFRDVASWNAMVAGYVKNGDVDGARELFEWMPERNVISWTTVIAGYVQLDRPSEAISVFRRMQLENVQPDAVVMLSVLSACAHLGAFELGEWIHNYIDTNRLRKTVPLSNALIDMYAKSGHIKKALDVFENMNARSVITWTTMIAGLALHGHGREAIEMFSRMENADVKPNDITLIAVLSACSHVGFVELGRRYFYSMGLSYGIKPKIEHYGCMIDLLGRAGCLQEAENLASEMPFEANGAIWGSLLAASRIHRDVGLGERALQHLTRVEPYHCGNYTILSNIYASVGRWKEAGMMRKVMRDKGVRKMPGESFIEVNNRVIKFNAEDRSHLQSESIFKVLSLINKQLKLAGYALLETDKGSECCSSFIVDDLV